MGERIFPAGLGPSARTPAAGIALAKHGADQYLIADLSDAVWCDLLLLIAAMDESEDVSCLLADPITGERAFRELLSWSMTGQIPPRYRRYIASSPLIANPIVIDRALHVVAPPSPS
jgi:hypothetical protein